MSLPAGVRGVLMDIEGTTTAIAFVYEVLFPYAAARLAATCAQRAAEPEVAWAIARLREEHAAEAAGGADGAGGAGGADNTGAGAGDASGAGAGPSLPPFGDGAAYAGWLMARDRKSTGLKALQGLIWETGYRAGELRGHVFADVPPALAAWHAAGVRLRIFSSGSRRAQQLLFAYSDHGDLTPLLDGYHDTTTGPKLERSSYLAIAEAFALPPGDLLYLSDVAGELDAAAAAGYRTTLLERPGNRPQRRGTHPACKSFGELAPARPRAVGAPASAGPWPPERRPA
jgi:enolase-phosphatase E1